LGQPLEGRQVGLIAAGSREVSFTDFAVRSDKPRAFIVMQFAEPYDTFYKEVIQSQAEKAGYEVVRIDEKAGPGIIFQDIQREIEQAEIVIAEITPGNPNVFYELGYAHALKKPTILLALRGANLPFDIQSFRVVFYNDTIGGKSEIEQNSKETSGSNRRTMRLGYRAMVISRSFNTVRQFLDVLTVFNLESK